VTVKVKKPKQEQAVSAKETEGEFKMPEPPSNKCLKNTGFAVYRKDKAAAPSNNMSIRSFMTPRKPQASQAEPQQNRGNK